MLKKSLYIAILFPMFLFAWGEDSYITTTSSSELTYSYDIVIPRDSLMFAAYEYVDYSNNNNNSVRVFVSRDTGKTWSQWTYCYNAIDSTGKYNRVALDFLEDSLVLFFPSKQNGLFYIYLLPFSDSSDARLGYYYYSFDTVFGMKFQNVLMSDGSYHFYVASMAKSNDTIYFDLLRSDDHGNTWNEIIKEAVSWSSDLVPTLLDFTAREYANDSVKMVYAVSYYDPNNNTRHIYGEIWLDILSQQAQSLSGLPMMLKPTGAYNECETDFLGNLVVWVIVDSCKLHFVYTSDNGDNLHYMEYPYNSDFNCISSVDLVKWQAYLYWGLDMSFVGDNKVWYQPISTNDNADSLVFEEEKVPVSDTLSAYTFPLNFSPYYKPRLRHWLNVTSPAIMWHNDYYHSFGTPPITVLDSTQFYVDYMGYTGVKEHKYDVNELNVKVVNNTLRISNVKNRARLTVMDPAGRVVKEKLITSPEKTVEINIQGLKRGIYFVTLGTGNKTFAGKFVKLK